MRVMLFFDLPVVTSVERKEYTKFHKFLIHEGFIMMQFSVYSKLVLNMTGVNLLKNRIKKKLPPKGMVQVLVITEKQFASIEDFVGEFSSNALGSEERLVIL